MSKFTERFHNMTEEEKVAYNEKKKVAAAKYKERQAEAKATIKEFIAEAGDDLPSEVKEAIQYLIGSGKRQARAKVTNVLRETLLENGTMTGLEVYTAFEYGTPTMKTKVRELIKNAEPEDRVWVAFESGNWVVKGTGPEAPEGWDGYMPPAPTESEEL